MRRVGAANEDELATDMDQNLDHWMAVRNANRMVEAILKQTVLEREMLKHYQRPSRFQVWSYRIRRAWNVLRGEE